jgi:hypothetical protein
MYRGEQGGKRSRITRLCKVPYYEAVGSQSQLSGIDSGLFRRFVLVILTLNLALCSLEPPGLGQGSVGSTACRQAL